MSDEARNIYTRFERELKACQSASGDLIGRGRGQGPFKSTFLLQKPKSFRVIDGQINIYCNGKVQFNHLVAEKEYFKRDVSKGFGFGAPYALDAFFGFPTGATAPYIEKKTEFRMQKVDGRICAAKAIHFESFDRDDRMVFFVDRATKRILGWDQVFGDTKMHYRFENLRFSVKVPAGAFDWIPMPGLKEKITRELRHPERFLARQRRADRPAGGVQKCYVNRPNCRAAVIIAACAKGRSAKPTSSRRGL